MPRDLAQVGLCNGISGRMSFATHTKLNLQSLPNPWPFSPVPNSEQPAPWLLLKSLSPSLCRRRHLLRLATNRPQAQSLCFTLCLSGVASSALASAHRGLGTESIPVGPRPPRPQARACPSACSARARSSSDLRPLTCPLAPRVSRLLSVWPPPLVFPHRGCRLPDGERGFRSGCRPRAG